MLSVLWCGNINHWTCRACTFIVSLELKEIDEMDISSLSILFPTTSQCWFDPEFSLWFPEYAWGAYQGKIRKLNAHNLSVLHCWYRTLACVVSSSKTWYSLPEASSLSLQQKEKSWSKSENPIWSHDLVTAFKPLKQGFSNLVAISLDGVPAFPHHQNFIKIIIVHIILPSTGILRSILHLFGLLSFLLLFK